MTAILGTDFREITQCIGSELMRPGSNEMRRAQIDETECRVAGCLAALSPRKDQKAVGKWAGHNPRFVNPSGREEGIGQFSQ